MYASLLSILLVTASASAETVPINLGECSRFALKAATDISFNGVSTTVKNGDIGISPGNGLSGSYTHTGSILLNTKETTDCDRDFTRAYNQAVAMTCDAANIFPELAGKTLSPGVYCSGSSMMISASTVTLDGKGDADAQWVFQVATALTTATTTSFILQNGAKSENVFWALGTSATIAYSSSFIGNILAQTQITFGSNSQFNGRALAFTAIAFESGSETSLPDLSAPITDTKQKRVGNTVQTSSQDAADFDITNCVEFAVNAGTSVNFDGDVTKISGLVGVSPCTAIQGNHEFTDAIYTLQVHTIALMYAYKHL